MSTRRHPTKSTPRPAAKSTFAGISMPRTHRIIYSLAALIALGGLVDAVYLLVQALTGETLTCGGSPDCFRVLGSAYAKIAGLPVAGFGAVAYFLAFGCAVFAASGNWPARRGFALVVGAMWLSTLWLLFVQAFLLHAFCRYCLLSAAATFCLAALAISMPGTLRQRA